MQISETLEKVKALVADGQIVVSVHGYDEMAADGIFLTDIIARVTAAAMVEDYPQADKGPSVLVLERDFDRQPIHVVWGIAKGTDGPDVLVTAYRPDPRRWSEDFMERRR